MAARRHLEVEAAAPKPPPRSGLSGQQCLWQRHGGFWMTGCGAGEKKGAETPCLIPCEIGQDRPLPPENPEWESHGPVPSPAHSIR
jgi:hypothetical protein